MLKIIVIVVASLCFYGIYALSNMDMRARGVYKAEGWAHGVAMCINSANRGNDQNMIIKSGLLGTDSYVTREYPNLVVVIETGYENDPQLKVLVTNAKAGCAKLGH
jgi:hypothetical protein